MFPASETWFWKESVPIPFQPLKATCIPWLVGPFLTSLQPMASSVRSPTDLDPPASLVWEPCNVTGAPKAISPSPHPSFYVPFILEGIGVTYSGDPDVNFLGGGAITQPTTNHAQAAHLHSRFPSNNVCLRDGAPGLLITDPLYIFSLPRSSHCPGNFYNPSALGSAVTFWYISSYQKPLSQAPIELSFRAFISKSIYLCNYMINW